MAEKKYKDTDLEILRVCREALLKSTSNRMLLANINYLVDLFVFHPSAYIVEHFKKAEQEKGKP